MRFLGQQMRTIGFSVCDAFQPFPSLGRCGFQIGICQPAAQQQGWKRISAPFTQTGCLCVNPIYCFYSLEFFCSQFLPACFLYYTFPQEHSINNVLVKYWYNRAYFITGARFHPFGSVNFPMETAQKLSCCHFI